MKFSCAVGCDVPRKRISIIEHCLTTKHELVIITRNRGHQTQIQGKIVRHAVITKPS